MAYFIKIKNLLYWQIINLFQANLNIKTTGSQ